ncbi:YihY/virulence factor BrkB family protein [Natronobeatus ordinarius]|uniref:YihY/virulence factor BrkB family protein n=1 Tax=Natronobeatus ordinarius TaxID=2963433 RepID=UPI0020CF14E2|nr:YhjD/YihY/BrkB family envelope integrity protein [Natronobeatus ordinarius]
MAASLREPVSFVKTVIQGISEENVTFMAAGIAYQAFISLIPLLVLVFFLVSAVGDEGLAATVTETTEGLLPEAGNELLEDAIAGSVATTGASVIGLVTLLWGSLKIFRGIDTAFSEIYESTGEQSFVGQLTDALVVFVAIVLALVAAAVATAVFAFVPDSPLVGVLNPLVLVVGLTVAFFPMYYTFPDVNLRAREVLPGVVVAAVGWAALQALFQVYVAFSAESDAAGAMGAILLLLTWLYFGGLVLLLGGVVNAASSGHLPAVRDDEGSDHESSDEHDRAVGERAEWERLERAHERLEREHALLRNDLRAQRSRRYRLEDRTDELETELRRLERENEWLSRRLERRTEPSWKRVGRRLLERTSVLSIGTWRERQS